jgi:hypothetical protein
MNLVSSFESLLHQLAFVMTVPTFASFVTLLTGWVFASRRNITRMICAAGAVGAKHHSAYHRVFAAASWSLDALGLAVFDLILPWLDDAVVMLAIDDTLARKRGLKIFGVGMHHDPLISTRKTALTNWGHSWVVLGVIVKFPFCSKRSFCLPILFRLYINKKTAAKQDAAYQTRPALAIEMLQVLCSAHEQRRFHVVGDSAYGGQNVLKHLPPNCNLTSRLDLDARLYEAPPQRKAGQNGRPRKRGKRLPTPRQMLKGHTRRLSLKIYGRRDRSRVADGVARVHAVPDRPLRVVAVKPLTGGRHVQAFYSTCHDASAKAVLTWYAMRWSIEEANQNSKTHLGFEEPQNWSRRAVERTAPVAMLLHSLIIVWFAREGHRYYRVPHRPWYRGKSHASFADMLATLRGQSIREQVLSMGLSGQDSRKVIETLELAVRQAA